MHDRGGDADAWGKLPGLLARRGFHTVSLEQRGHGLSDGEPDPCALEGDLAEVCAALRADGRRIALVAAGGACGPALRLGPAHGVAIHVLLSPLPVPGPEAGDGGPARPAGVDTAKLLVGGSADPAARRDIEACYRGLRGWTLWASVPVTEQGTELLRCRLATDIQDTIAAFLRRHIGAAAGRPSPQGVAQDEGGSP